MKWLVLVTGLLLCSCITKEIPIETLRTEYVTETKIDSVVIKDSIREIINSDTTYIYKEHIIYKYTNRIDTVERVDSIPYIKVQEVEKRVYSLYLYQRILIIIGIAAILFLIGFIIYKFK